MGHWRRRRSQVRSEQRRVNSLAGAGSAGHQNDWELTWMVCRHDVLISGGDFFAVRCGQMTVLPIRQGCTPEVIDCCLFNFLLCLTSKVGGNGTKIPATRLLIGLVQLCILACSSFSTSCASHCFILFQNSTSANAILRVTSHYSRYSTKPGHHYNIVGLSLPLLYRRTTHH